MTDSAAGAAGVPAPTVGLSLPGSPALEAALDQLQAAKQAHQTNPTDDTRTVLRDAKAAVRYQRWIVRGGTAEAPTKATRAFHDRYAAEGTNAVQEG